MFACSSTPVALLSISTRASGGVLKTRFSSNSVTKYFPCSKTQATLGQEEQHNTGVIIQARSYCASWIQLSPSTLVDSGYLLKSAILEKLSLKAHSTTCSCNNFKFTSKTSSSQWVLQSGVTVSPWSLNNRIPETSTIDARNQTQGKDLSIFYAQTFPVILIALPVGELLASNAPIYISLFVRTIIILGPRKLLSGLH